MSEFGGDPDAQLMDSTRGVIRSCTTTFAFLGPECIELLLATHFNLVLYYSLVGRMYLSFRQRACDLNSAVPEVHFILVYTEGRIQQSSAEPWR